MTDSADSAAHGTADQADDEEYYFPTLAHVLIAYFAEGKELKFLELYERHGERRSEFAGLTDELRQAMKKSQRATREINGILGTELAPSEVRIQLSELLDQLLEQGDFSPEQQEADRKEAKEAKDAKKATPADLLAYYFTRRRQLPDGLGRFSGLEFPLWAALAAGFLFLAVASFLHALNPPQWLAWFPAGFAIVGMLIVGLVAVGMLGLRDELAHPDRAEKRRRAREEDKKRRKEKRAKRANETTSGDDDSDDEDDGRTS